MKGNGGKRPAGGYQGGKGPRHDGGAHSYQGRAGGYQGKDDAGFRQDSPPKRPYQGPARTGDARPGYQGKPYKGQPGEKPFSREGGPAYGNGPQRGDGRYQRDERPYRRDGAPGERPAREQPRTHQPRTPLHPDERTEAPRAPEVAAPENMLIGRNPIREALKAGRHFEALYVVKGEINGSAREIVRVAKEKRVIVKEVDRRALDAMSPGHQGLIGVVSAHQYATVQDMLALAKQRGEEALIVVLDGITDPHNFGAIARTAECCGAHGVIVCERRAVGMTPGAAKAAAGAFEYIPVARVTNVSRAIDDLKAAGLWVYAADQDDDALHYKTDLKGPVALVIGDEGEGVSRLALEKCDARVAIPIRGKIESLNASVAAGILLYEVVRQRDAG